MVLLAAVVAGCGESAQVACKADRRPDDRQSRRRRRPPPRAGAIFASSLRRARSARRGRPGPASSRLGDELIQSRHLRAAARKLADCSPVPWPPARWPAAAHRSTRSLHLANVSSQLKIAARCNRLEQLRDCARRLVGVGAPQLRHCGRSCGADTATTATTGGGPCAPDPSVCQRNSPQRARLSANRQAHRRTAPRSLLAVPSILLPHPLSRLRSRFSFKNSYPFSIFNHLFIPYHYIYLLLEFQSN